MSLDAYKNFAIGTLSTGINSSATSLSVTTGHGARFPAVPFNGTIYNSTDYTDAAAAVIAGHGEIVRVTALSSDSFSTIVRAQEGTTAVNLNTGGKTYTIVAGLTAKLLTDLAATFAATSHTHAASELTAGLLTENAYIGLAATLSADGKFSGITEDGTAGATLAFGDLCYFSVTDSRWELADADADATSGAVMLGICVLAAASDGSSTRMLRFGKIRADAAFPTLTVGAPVYAGTTAGDIQTAQPSGTDDVVRIVGYGVTADVLFFNPSNDYITHT